MISRFINSLILSLFAITGLGQIFETNIKVASVHSFLNQEKYDKPLFVQSDGVYFNNGFVDAKPTVDYQVSWKTRMFDKGIIFGMSLGLRTFDNTTTGNIHNSDGSILSNYKLERGGSLFNMSCVLGYKFNTFKTFRPFLYADLGIMSVFFDQLYSSEISNPNFDYNSSLDLYTSTEIRKRFGVIAGFEYRKFKLTFEYHRMREKLVYDDKGGSLNYSKRRTLSLGLAYRFAPEFKREVYDVSTNIKPTKELKLKQRKPQLISFFVGAGSNIYLGGFGFSSGTDVSFLQVQKSLKPISSATTKEENTVTVLEMEQFDSEFRGFPRGSLGFSLHRGPFELETMGHYYAFTDNQEYWFYQNKVSRFISNGNAGNYYIDGDNYKIDPQYSLRYKMETVGYTANLKIDFSDLSTEIKIPYYIGIGWNTTYVRLKNELFVEGNVNSEPISQEILNLYTGQANSDNLGLYFNPDETNYYFSDDDDVFIELVENREEKFIAFEDLKSMVNTKSTKLSGISFCVGATYNRFDFRFGFDFTKTNAIAPIRKLNSAYASVNYHIWGR